MSYVFQSERKPHRLPVCCLKGNFSSSRSDGSSASFSYLVSRTCLFVGKHANVLNSFSLKGGQEGFWSDRLKKTFLIFVSDSLHNTGGLPLYKEAIRRIRPSKTFRESFCGLAHSLLRHREMTKACHFWLQILDFTNGSPFC